LNIRCERCSTTYELDETLLAPGGSPVQCTKCQHVFTAVPPRTAGRTLIGVPAAPAPHPVAPPKAPVAEPQPPTGPRQGPAIYRPSPAAASPTAGARNARARRDTMGAFEARLKASQRLRWLVPLVVVILAILVGGGWMLLSRRVDPGSARRYAEAMALVALDDLESLEKANKALEELGRTGSAIESLDADRALSQLLLATGVMEEVAAASARLAAKTAERDRATSSVPAPTPDALGALTAEVEALRSQVEPKQAAARALSERAYGALRQMAAERGGEVPVARALAIHFASIGDREQALRFIRGAGPAAEKDPWIQLAEGWLDAREGAKESHERAVAKLSALVRARPEAVRARFLLARAQAALGRREAAAATLDGLLAVSPRHARASRLRGEFVAPQQPQPGPSGGQLPGPRPVPVWPSTSSTVSARSRPASPSRCSRSSPPASRSAAGPGWWTRSATAWPSASWPGWWSARRSASTAPPSCSPS